MKRVFKAAMLGWMAGLFGVVVFFGFHQLEENFGLDLLFKIRGSRTPPDEVMVVAIDRMSSETFSLPTDLRKWPRSLHGRLTEKLHQQGAAAIVFDVVFDDPGPDEQDRAFADAVRRAGNVALCVRIEKESVAVETSGGVSQGRMEIEKLIPPASHLAAAARVTAPFPVPKVPHKISQYWAFKQGAGMRPTLPVAAFQLYTLPAYEAFVSVMAEAVPGVNRGLPTHLSPIGIGEDLAMLASRIRQRFEENEDLYPAVVEVLGQFPRNNHYRLMAALAKMYGEGRSRYLDFYGPPGTVQTVPYYRIIQNDDWDVKGKAVFVGLSERLRPQHKDGFYTVFSSSEGLDLSGVEIAATAFANLLEGRSVVPLESAWAACLLIGWGVLIGTLCTLTGPATALAGLATAGALYFFFSIRAFSGNGVWVPVMVPFLFQAPLAYFGSILMKYSHASREKSNIQQALGYHIPGQVVDRIASKLDADFTSQGELAHGVCLSTDGEQYTGLSETMDPEALSKFMNRYYEVIFTPVRRHGGIISDVVGDAMLAIWSGGDDSRVIHQNACLAAVEIAHAVERFNQTNVGATMPTRIGLHAGPMRIGHIGAVDHYEYRAVGDTVNTATRIEKLNRHLGTDVLVSMEAIEGLHDLAVRPLGRFLLAGKSKPTTVCELADPAEGRNRQTLWAQFGEALDVFRRKDWEKAHALFARLAGETGDGPSLFYALVCKRYSELPPAEGEADMIRMEQK